MGLSWGSPAEADVELLSLGGKPALSRCAALGPSRALSGPQSDEPRRAGVTGLILLWGNPG